MFVCVCVCVCIHIYVYMKVTGKETGKQIQVFFAYILYLLVSVEGTWFCSCILVKFSLNTCFTRLKTITFWFGNLYVFRFFIYKLPLPITFRSCSYVSEMLMDLSQFGMWIIRSFCSLEGDLCLDYIVHQTHKHYDRGTDMWVADLEINLILQLGFSFAFISNQ